MPLCPRCRSPTIEDDTIACPSCKTVVRFFCEACQKPVLINERHCPWCGVPNANYDPTFDEAGCKHDDATATIAMESEFDVECSDIANEIAELKRDLGRNELADTFSAARTKQEKPDKQLSPSDGQAGLVGVTGAIAEPATDEAHLFIQSMATSPADLQPDEPEPPQKAVFAWDCDVVVHSKNGKEPVHIGLGTDPWKAKGIPGTAIFTQSSFIFISYIPQLRNINEIFAYVCFDISALNGYNLDPAMSRNYLIFNSTGLFKKKFPGTLAINVHFTWSKDAVHGDVQNQMIQFKSLVERLKLFKKGESKLLSGDYLFTQGKRPADHAEIKDVLQELKAIPTIHEILADRYPSLGKI